MANAAGGAERPMGEASGTSQPHHHQDRRPSRNATSVVRPPGAFTVRAGLGTPTGMQDASARPLAVVTGASSGIGYELAKQFATNGFDLVVCAEDDAVVTAASEMEGLGARTEAVQADLTTAAGGEQLYGRVHGRPGAAIGADAGLRRGRAVAA